jgi:hypothetical protein
MPVDNAVLYIPRAMMRRVDGKESILGTELVDPAQAATVQSPELHR